MDKLVTIPYDEAVTEARALFDRAEHDLWRVAEIVARLEPKYGEGTLAKFADDIQRKYETIREYRETYQAWNGVLQNTGQPVFLPLTVAAQLNAHPDKERILLEHPDLKKEEARKIMQDYNEAHGKKKRGRKKAEDKPKPDPKPKPEPLTGEELKAALKDYDDLKMSGKEKVSRTDLEKLGHSPVVAAQAIAIRLTEEKQKDYDPSKEQFSQTVQQRFDAAIKAYQKKLELEFWDKVRAETQRHLDERILPLYAKRRAEADYIIEHQKGVFTADEYKAIIRCLHPDTQASTEQRNRAFALFNEHKAVLLVADKAAPSGPGIPRTVAEMMAMKKTKTR